MKEIVTKKKCGGRQNHEIFFVASLVAASKVDSFKCKLLFMELATNQDLDWQSRDHCFMSMFSTRGICYILCGQR